MTPLPRPPAPIRPRFTFSLAPMTRMYEAADIEAAVTWTKFLRFIMATSLLQVEREKSVPGGDQQVLLPVQRVGLGRVRNLANPRVPQDLPVGGIVRDNVPAHVPCKDQLAGCREHAGTAAAARRTR